MCEIPQNSALPVSRGKRRQEGSSIRILDERVMVEVMQVRGWKKARRSTHP